MINQFSRINRTFILHYTTLIGTYIMPPYVDVLYGLNRVEYTGLFAYSLKLQDDWHTLAYKFFKNGSLWWVIADLSDVLDPFSALIPGNSVYLPSTNALLFDILNFNLEDRYV